MELKTIIKQNVGKEWNELVKTHNLATFHQTSNYAEYWQHTRGQPSYFISIMNGNDVVALLVLHKASLLQRRLETKFQKFSFSSSIFSFVKNVKTLYIWEYGPLIFNNNYKSEIFSEINKLKKIFKGHIDGSFHPLEETSSQLIKDGWTEKKLGTFLIDLTLSEDELWKNIDRRSGRKAVNRAQKNEIKIKIIENLDDLQIHHKLLNEGRKIANLPQTPYRNVEAAWNTLKDVGLCGFIAWLDNTPLASTIMTTFNGYINEMGFARSKLDLENLYCATDLIKWHIIQWGHKSGLKTFDLSGVDPYSEDKKLRGIFNFKKKWGGILHDWYHYSSV